MRNIDLIRNVSAAAAGRWPFVLDGLRVTVPSSSSIHSPCPACGGKDRFRFDDNGRGSHICNKCGAGDGLDLVAKIFDTDATEAAKAVADVLGIDYRTAQTTSQRVELSEAEREYRRQEQAELKAHEQAEKLKRFTVRYSALSAQAVEGVSSYLTNKGLNDFIFPLLADGSLLLPLVDGENNVTGAQTITPSGEKRLLADSTKKGSYYPVNAPETISTVIITEGVATALSVHLMRPDALTVCAIDAGNLLPVAKVFCDQYASAQIIIAADNDIRPNEPNTGKEAAEKAALSVAGWVAVPPTYNKADWNDYHQQNGLNEAIEAFNDGLYQPQENNATVKLKAIDNGKITARNLPENGKDTVRNSDPLKPHIDSRDDGVFYVTPKVDKDSGEIINNESWLCSPLSVAGIGTDGANRYVIIRWTATGDSAEAVKAIPLADIGEREGWRAMKSGGVNVTTKTGLRAILADWLQRCADGELWRIAHATGWQYGAYLMPDGEVIGTPAHNVLFDGRSSAAAGYTVKGTADSWRGSVARLVEGNYSMMTATAAAFAAPLIGLADVDGFGLHFYEQSSAGKTTTANVAASLYGSPDLLRLTWYGTALGLANEAAAHNDALMPLDEIGQGADPVEVYKSAYALFNGTGKLQGAKEGGNRELKSWRTIAISTGEVDLETFISGAGRKAKAGQLVRLLNIPLSKAIRFHEHQNGKQHADALKNAYQHHHGAVGRAWIKHLATSQKEAINAVREAEERWRSLLPSDYGEQVHRVGARFAILEAALLLSRSFTGWDEQTCKDAIQYTFNAWLRMFGTGNKEHQQIIEQCEAFLNAYGFSRYLPYPDTCPRDLPIKDLAGYRTGSIQNEGDKFVFYTFPEAFEKEIARNFNPKMFAKVLAHAGMLEASQDRYKRKALKRIGGKQHTFYILTYQPEDDDSEGN